MWRLIFGILRTLRKVSGIFLMYDITNQETFEHCVNWLKEARQRAQEGAQILLVGNKSDQKARRQVSTSTAEAFARKHDHPHNA
jgi:GTPase SAR1 family protein